MQNKKFSHSKSKKTAKVAPARKAVKAKARAGKPKAHVQKRTAMPKIIPVKKLGVRAQAKKLSLEKMKAAAAVALERKKAEQNMIGEIVERASFSEFMSQNIGKRAGEIIKLIRDPQTDEQIAATLGMKINEARRILNVLSSYGVARYDANKDSKGWLTFEWYLDSEKLAELDNKIATKKPESAYALPENCNDFFYCSKCYDEQKMILPFDAAFENQFKCDGCGNKLKQLSRSEAASLFEQEAAAQVPE
jgi:transcription factor E